jgi:phospholipid-binding lipoprotein MlaA
VALLAAAAPTATAAKNKSASVKTMKSTANYCHLACGKAVLSLMLLILAGCATGPNANPADPLEPFNRGVASFNEGVDNAVIKPVATAYRNVTPSPVRTGVNNFFNNLEDMWSTVNAAFQLRPQAAVENTMRVAFNTFFGLGGLLDIASEAGMERHKEDFGKTLGRWGVGAGPYIVLPLFGPSTLRDTAAFPVNSYGSVLGNINDVPARNSLTALNLVDTRSKFLRAGAMVDDVALDKYSFVRDAHLQRRAASIYGYKDPEDKPEKDAPPAGATPADKK